MKNKKGFTLVELMAVLVILSVILLMSVPSITKTLNGSEENELKEYKNTLCLAAQSYLQLEDSGVPTAGKYVQTSVLLSKGYITDTLKNPKTGTLDTRIYVKKESSGVTCQL